MERKKALWPPAVFALPDIEAELPWTGWLPKFTVFSLHTDGGIDVPTGQDLMGNKVMVH